MDGQYQEKHETTWPRRPNDGRQEGVVNDGGKGRHTKCTRPKVRSKSEFICVCKK